MKLMKARKAYDFNKPNSNDPSEQILELIEDPEFGMDAKRDGTRAQIYIDEEGNMTIFGRGTVQEELHSEKRQQRIYNQTFPELVKRMPELKCSRFDCEITIRDPNTGLENYNILETRVNRKTDIATYAKLYPASVEVFDILEFLGEDLTSRPLRERKQIQMGQFGTDLHKHREYMNLPFYDDKKLKLQLVIESLRLGLEGVMIKHLDGKYVEGPGDWYKAKRTHTEDVFVLGMSPGLGKFSPYFGKLHCFQLIDNIPKFVCDVGGGFDFTQMKFIKEFIGEYLPKPKSDNEAKQRYQYLKERHKLMVIEVKHYGIVKTGRRHPNFVRIRTDKDPEECTNTTKVESASMNEWI